MKINFCDRADTVHSNKANKGIEMLATDHQKMNMFAHSAVKANSPGFTRNAVFNEIMIIFLLLNIRAQFPVPARLSNALALNISNFINKASVRYIFGRYN